MISWPYPDGRGSRSQSMWDPETKTFSEGSNKSERGVGMREKSTYVALLIQRAVVKTSINILYKSGSIRFSFEIP